MTAPPRTNTSRHAILGVLSLCPMSGYDVKKLIERSIAHFWNESYGQIYPILNRLAAEGFAERRREKQTGKPDRYVYSLIARAIVRGADPEWIKRVFSFALKPNAVFYLRIEVPELVPRVLQGGGFDYWESGMDIPMGEDLYESFVHYQERVIAELDALGHEFGFQTLDATQPVDEVADGLARRVEQLLDRSVSPTAPTTLVMPP